MSNIVLEISDHAYDRIKQRLNTSDKKIDKLVSKAWNSQITTARKFIRAEYKSEIIGRECRELMGYVFVFAVEDDKRILITIF